MNAQKSYWHLAQLGRVPNDYDIATSRLLYYPDRGFEVRTPIADWYARHQTGSRLRVHDWEVFRDPRETTYTRYTEIQKQAEVYVDGLLRSLDQAEYDRQLSSAWLRILDRVIGPMRFPVHGLQMVAAYVGSMAPSGRIVVTCLLQAADEIRRIQHLTQRMRQLQATCPAFGTHSRELWQEDPCWQPLRRAIERLLVAYDWGEALIALNLVLKPAFDSVLTVQLARLAERHGDTLLSKLVFALEQDCRWHRQWSQALMRVAIADSTDNSVFLRGIIEQWQPAAQAAAHSLIELFELDARERSEALLAVEQDCALLWQMAAPASGGDL